VERIDTVRQIARAKGSEAVLVTFLPDVRWACGFTGSNGLLIVLPDAAHLITDGRYTTQAKNEVEYAEVHITSINLFEHAAAEGVLAHSSSVLYQADRLTVSQFESVQRHFSHVTWIGADELLVHAVASKSPEEVEYMRQAQRLSEHVFEQVLNVIQLGVTEKDIAAEIVYQHMKGGAERMAFESIVASGPNGALPHARPTSRQIQSGDMVVLDFGCHLGGYASDMTRTVAVGEPGDEARSVYDVVLRAQQAALEAARAGIPSADLDAAARRVIERAGFGDYFSHGLGHGVGLQVHEWPRVSHSADYVLPVYAAVTIEPGV
jgi:Xaa-Pro aminopeptidase